MTKYLLALFLAACIPGRADDFPKVSRVLADREIWQSNLVATANSYTASTLSLTCTGECMPCEVRIYDGGPGTLFFYVDDKRSGSFIGANGYAPCQLTAGTLPYGVSIGPGWYLHFSTSTNTTLAWVQSILSFPFSAVSTPVPSSPPYIPTASSTFTPTATPTVTPTVTLTRSPTKTFTPTATPTSTKTVTATFTPTPSITRTATPTKTVTPTPTP